MDAERTELLVRLLTRHQDELFRFILALFPDEEVAEDILQETSVALCRKIGEYNPDQPFMAWAYGFAYMEVLKARERVKHDERMLSSELVHRLSVERAEYEKLLDARKFALDLCLQKLTQDDRELLRRRYLSDTGIDDLVEESGASRRTLFRNLERIRRILLKCIDRRVASTDHP